MPLGSRALDTEQFQTLMLIRGYAERLYALDPTDTRPSRAAVVQEYVNDMKEISRRLVTT